MKCPICNTSIKDDNGLSANQPLELYRRCKFCKRIKFILFLFTLISSIVIILAFFCSDFKIPKALSSLGLVFNMWGAFLVATGYLEEIYIASALVGGEIKLDLAQKNIPIGRWGVFLLILGFLLMGISQFVN